MLIYKFVKHAYIDGNPIHFLADLNIFLKNITSNVFLGYCKIWKDLAPKCPVFLPRHKQINLLHIVGEKNHYWLIRVIIKGLKIIFQLNILDKCMKLITFKINDTISTKPSLFNSSMSVFKLLFEIITI